MTIAAWTIICMATLFLASLPSAVSDIRRRLVPNRHFILIGCLWLTWRIGCMWIAWQSGDPATIQCELSRSLSLALQATVAYVALLVATLAYERLTGRFAMGGADLKFIAACTAFLGWEAALLATVLGCAAGILYPLGAAVARRPSRGIPLVAAIASTLPLAGLII